MKARLFSATLLVVVFVIVLAVPASAVKLEPVPRISVGEWTWEFVPGEGGEYMSVAHEITWKNAPAGAYLVPVNYVCTAGTRPGKGCEDWSPTGVLFAIPPGSGSWEGPELGVASGPSFPCGVTYFPAMLLATSPGVDTVTVFAFALSDHPFKGEACPL